MLKARSRKGEVAMKWWCCGVQPWELHVVGRLAQESWQILAG